MEHKQDIETPIADEVLRDDAHTETVARTPGCPQQTFIV
jgi:hypothetical protein